MILILASFKTREDAVKISRELLEDRLIAGFNLWPAESSYWSHGTIEERADYLVVMRSTVRWFDDVADLIQARSGYKTPEVIAVDSEKMELDYQRWINDSLR